MERREQGDLRRVWKLGPLVEEARHSMLYIHGSHSNSAVIIFRVEACLGGAKPPTAPQVYRNTEST